MDRHSQPARRGFTLTELLMVLGLIALLASLLMPVIGKVRAAAQNASCLSNLRRMSVAWSLHVAENHGQFPEYVWHTPTGTAESAWYGYWPGLIDKNGVKADSILCPAAREESTSLDRQGFGSVSQAWSGKYASSGSAVRLSDRVYRASSYGYNRYLTAGGKFSSTAEVNCLGALNDASNVPLFLDCAYADVKPFSRGNTLPPEIPPNLTGASVTDRSPQHWRFLLGRHGRGINVAMADGSGRWIRLDDTYTLRWTAGWEPLRLRLPNN